MILQHWAFFVSHIFGMFVALSEVSTIISWSNSRAVQIVRPLEGRLSFMMLGNETLIDSVLLECWCFL